MHLKDLLSSTFSHKRGFKDKKLSLTLSKQEEDPTTSAAASSDDQLRRINSQLGLDVASKLGFVDAKDLVCSEDLQVRRRAAFTN